MTTLFISHSSKDKAWAEAIDAGLQRNSYQTFLDSHPDHGIHPGAQWERMLWQRLHQCRGVVVLCTKHWLSSPWCIAEAMLAREKRKLVFLLASEELIDGRQVKGAEDSQETPTIPDFLKDMQFISLQGLTREQAFDRLLHGLAQEHLRDHAPLPRRPYPGLEPFQESDAAVFFGRDDDITRVTDVLHQRQRKIARGFIVVLGASGSGKSSLVRAGVLPWLRHKADIGEWPRDWVITPPFYGGSGLDGLTRSLQTALGHEHPPVKLDTWLEAITTTVETNSGNDAATAALRALANALLVAHGKSEGHVLLVLDQLEEVFGTAPGSSARALLSLLLEAAAQEGSPIVMLATMRSDFLNTFQLFPGAEEHYEGITLDPMARSHFGELIAGPAERFGLRLGPGLIERLVADTQHDDALPLLSYTLEQLYALGSADGELTLHEYETAFPPVQVRRDDGTRTEYRGVSAAIKHVANRILENTGYLKLPEDDPRMQDLRRAFYSLVQVSEAGHFSGRTALWSEMPASCEAVLNRFVKERLLVQYAEHGERSLRIAHEVLFRVWSDLGEWLRDRMDVLQWRRRRKSQLDDWVSHGRDIERDYLSGASLGEAKDLLEKFRDLLSDDEQRFVNDSLERAHREDERQRRAYQVSLSRQLAAQAQVIVQLEGPELTERGILLAAEGMKRCTRLGVPSLEADQALRQGLSISARRLVDLSAETDIDWQAIAAQPRSGQVAYGGKDGRTWLWNPWTGSLNKGPRLGGSISAVEYSPDGKWLAFGDESGNLCLLNAEKEELQPVLQPVTEGLSVRTICFSRDSQLFAVAFHNRIAIWGLDPVGTPVFLEHKNERPVVSMAFEPDGEILATQEVMGETLIWKWRTQEIVGKFEILGNYVTHSQDGRFLGVSSPSTFTAFLWDVFKQEGQTLATNAAKLAFSPDGRFVGIASPEHFARIWTVPDLKPMHTFRHNAEVWNLEFSPDGSRLVTWAKNNVAHVWDTEMGAEIARMIHHEHLWSARFLSDSRHLLTHSGDRVLRIWDSQELREIRLFRHEVAVLGVAFSSDGRYLATNARQSLFGHVPVLIEVSSQQPVAKVMLPDGSEAEGAAYASQLLEDHDKRSRGDVHSTKSGLIAKADGTNVNLFIDTTEGDPIRVLPHDHEVSRIVFSPDGQHLVTASDHDTGRIWELESGQEVARLSHERPNVTDVDFSPDGRFVATASWDFTARIWLWQPEDLILEAAGRVGRNLTANEWHKYLSEESYSETFPDIGSPSHSDASGEQELRTGIEK